MTTNQKLTEIRRWRFDELVSGISDDSLLEKWADDFEPKTKADQIELRQIFALGCWIDSGRSLEELQTMKWSLLEFWIDGKTVSVKVMG